MLSLEIGFVLICLGYFGWLCYHIGLETGFKRGRAGWFGTTTEWLYPNEFSDPVRKRVN